MAPVAASCFWPAARLLGSVVVLAGTVPTCLDWLSQPSDWAVLGGALGLLALAAGFAVSLYQFGRCLRPFLSFLTATYD